MRDYGYSQSVTTVAVVAHRKKSFGGGLDELRRRITEQHGMSKLLWYEVSKSRKAGRKARRAVKDGARLVFVWGGDGMVQRCFDALAGAKVDLAVVPAGTANLLADGSPFVRTTRAKTVDVRLAPPMTYELDGGARDTVKRLKARVVPSAITIRVPV